MCKAFLLAVLASAAFAVVASTPAHACSVCLPGDPHYSSLGASAGEEGSFALYLETRGYAKKSGALPHGGEHEEEEMEHAGTEDSRGQRSDLFASWTPIDRFTFTLDVPVVWTRLNSEHHDERTRRTLSGLGDVSLWTSAVLWRDRPVLPSRWLEGRVFVEAPTGRDETKVDGERDPHLQPGSGSWDWGVGLAGVQRTQWGSIYGSVLRRWNEPGALDYEYGDVWLATLALEASLGHLAGRPALDFLTPGLGLDFRYAGYDEQDGERYRDSGGAILYATPSLRIRLPFGAGEQRASLRLAAQLPLGQSWLHNEQYEKVVWSVGILLPF
jgi:hypothetical protein